MPIVDQAVPFCKSKRFVLAVKDLPDFDPSETCRATIGASAIRARMAPSVQGQQIQQFAAQRCERASHTCSAVIGIFGGSLSRYSEDAL